MIKIKKFLPGQRVILLDKVTLIAAGYPDNNDAEDFLNLLAGKTVTIKESFEDGEIYTCEEYPEIAIYRVFINKLELFDEFSFDEITEMMGFKTTQSNTRKMVATACKHLRDLFPKSFNMNEELQ